MNTKLKDLKRLQENAEQEQIENQAIKQSEEYLKKEEAVQLLQDELKGMTSSLYTRLYEEMKNEIFEEIKMTKDFEGVEPIYKNKNKVNSSSVLDVLQGDIGLFFEVIGITQKSLKDFSQSFPKLKKDFKNCIETTKELVGFEIL